MAAALEFIPEDKVDRVADIMHDTYRPNSPGVGSEIVLYFLNIKFKYYFAKKKLIFIKIYKISK